MENEKAYLDIDELAKKIEERIKALESQNKEEKKKEKKVTIDKKVSDKVSDLDKIINEIDKRIKELDEEEISEFDVDLLMDKINDKLSKEEDIKNSEVYNLEEVTKAINETIKALEEKRRKKKAKKAKYCDLARRNNYKK